MRAVSVLVSFRVADGHRPAAGGGDRLQVLAAHDRAHAAAAGGAVLVVHDGGEKDPVLAGRADAGHRGLGGGLRLDGLLRLLGVEAPQGRRVADLDLAVMDVEVDGLRGPAADDQPVEPGAFEHRAETAARARIADGPGQGRTRDDLVAARGHHRPGQRPGHEDQGVVGGQGVGRGRAQVAVQLDAQPAAAEVPAPRRVADGDGFLRHAAQVDLDDFPHPAVHRVLSIRRIC